MIRCMENGTELLMHAQTVDIRHSAPLTECLEVRLSNNNWAATGLVYSSYEKCPIGLPSSSYHACALTMILLQQLIKLCSFFGRNALY